MKFYKKSLLILLVLFTLILCIGSISASDYNETLSDNTYNGLLSSDNAADDSSLLQDYYYDDYDDSNHDTSDYWIDGAEDINMDYGSDSFYDVYVKDYDDNPVYNEHVDLYIDDELSNYGDTDDDGLVSFPLCDLKPGKHTVNAYLANNHDIFTNNTVTVTDYSNYKLIGHNLKKYYGENGRYTVQLTNSNDEQVYDKYVYVKIAKHTYKIKTNYDGIASLAINLNPGKYSVISTFHGNTVRNTVNVLSIPAKFKILSGSRISKGSYFYVKLINKNNNKVIKNKKVVIRINGKNHSVKTSSKGIAKLKLNLKPKKYTVSVKIGQKGYSVKSVKKTVRVTMPNIIITGPRPKEGWVDCNGMIVSHRSKYRYTYVGPCRSVYYGKVKMYGVTYRKYSSEYVCWVKCHEPDYHNEWSRDAILRNNGLLYDAITCRGYTYVKIGVKTHFPSVEKVVRQIINDNSDIGKPDVI